jgi:TRAP-type C4-dicarboxylate transport system permease small subunit
VNPIKGVAFVLIAVGVIGLAYGGFSYTKDTKEAQIGSLALTVKDKQTVNIPIWAGVAAIVIGAGLLLVPSEKK